MPNVNTSYQTITQLLKNQGKCELEKEQFLKFVKKMDKDLAAKIEKSVEGVTNPIFEMTGKATANYNIAGLKIKSGDKVIGSGAVSRASKDITEIGELKGYLDLPNGESIRMYTDLDAFDPKMMVYKGEKNELSRICSIEDSDYEEIVNRISNFTQYRFNGKNNSTYWKCGENAITNVKVQKGKDGVTKINGDHHGYAPFEEIINAEGKMVAGTRYFNQGLEKCSRCYIEDCEFCRTLHFNDSIGKKPEYCEYEFEVPGITYRMKTTFDKSGKEVFESLYTVSPQGNGRWKGKLDKQPKEIQDVFKFLIDYYDNTVKKLMQ